MMAEWQATGVFMTIDKMISPALQDAMVKNWEVDSVFELESGHFPTSSVPDELADAALNETIRDALTPSSTIRRVFNISAIAVVDVWRRRNRTSDQVRQRYPEFL